MRMKSTWTPRSMELPILASWSAPPLATPWAVVLKLSSALIPFSARRVRQPAQSPVRARRERRSPL